MHTLLDSLNWRYAVKKYDPARLVSTADLAQLQAAAQLAPSSHGLQPYRMLVVTDAAVRARLRAASYNQPQITEASYLLVFAIETRVDGAYVEAYFEQMCRTRQVELTGGLLQHRNSVAATVARMSAAEQQHWATNQAYLALGMLLLAAAQLRIDANPMEGFVASEYDELLGLRERGLHAVVIAGLGYRHPDDPFQHFQKVRRPADDLFIAI